MNNTIENQLSELSKSKNFNKVRNWAKQRGILMPNNQLTQSLKLVEEFGELCGGVLKNDDHLIEDSIGDMVVVLINLNKINGFDLEFGLKTSVNYEIANLKDKKEILSKILELINDTVKYNSNITLVISYSVDIIQCLSLLHNLTYCLDLSWNEIKDRKGKNVDGNFIKD